MHDRDHSSVEPSVVEPPVERAEPLQLPVAPAVDVAGDAPGPAAQGPAEPGAGEIHLAAHLAKGDRRDADTIWRRNPREQGLLGLTDAIECFGRRGWSISVPLIDSQPYDLVVDDGAVLHRVQVKTTTYRSPHGVFVASLATRGGNQSFHSSRDFDPSSCDLLYVLTDGRDRYLIPTGVIRARTVLHLGARLERYRLGAVSESGWL